MKVKSLLMLGAFLMVSGGTMAQTTITAGNAKVISANEVQLNYYYTNSEVMGGFQMVVSIPDGVSLEENAEKTANGLSINGGEPAKNAVFYNVTVPTGFECIGVKADVPGTTSDGTAYDAGDVLLVCFPVQAGAKYKATETASKLCSLTLTTTDGIAEDVLKTVAIKGFAGSDTNGTGGEEAAAKYVASAESKVSPAKVLKVGDVNEDNDIGVGDLIAVSNYMAGGEGSGFSMDQADVNNDEDVGVGDLISISNIMAGN